jgi:hypothetical protein
MAMVSSDARLTKRQMRAKPILFFNGDKGGVGKSFLARIVAAMLIRRGYSLIGIDGDSRNGHLNRYHGNSFPVHRIVLRENEGWADVIDIVGETRDEVVILIDLPAGAGEDLEAQMRRLARGLPAERPVIHVWVACEEEDSITLFERVNWLAKPERTIFVMNGRFGPPETFALWNNYPGRTEYLREGGSETYVTPLPIGVRAQFARHRTPFHLVEDLDLLRSQKIDFYLWEEDMEEALAGLLDLVRGES